MTVDCKNCCLCCLHDLIVLHPELGDDPKNYATVELPNGTHVLQRKPSGACWYLDEENKRCKIHDVKPAICNEFDCADFIRRTTRYDRRRLVKIGMIGKDVLNKGVELYKQQEKEKRNGKRG